MGDSPAANAARSEPPPTAKGPPPPSPKTIPATPVAKKKWPTEEPEPVRCPGCGVKSHAARCPNCGSKLRHDDD
jgi:DNA-directed RNA polymerase subunit RPC12/RpoP